MANQHPTHLRILPRTVEGEQTESLAQNDGLSPREGKLRMLLQTLRVRVGQIPGVIRAGNVHLVQALHRFAQGMPRLLKRCRSGAEAGPSAFHAERTLGPTDADGHIHGLAGLNEIMERAKVAATRATRLFPIVTGGVFCTMSLAVTLLVVVAGLLIFPECPPVFPLLIALLPSVLIAATLAHAAGNFLIGRVTRFNSSERRSLALHLPWNRAPEGWPGYFRRWIYCGDWLVENFSGDLMPYVRAFVTGEIPQNIEEELELWSCLMQNSRQRRDFEVGHSVRELACVDALPGWTREITPGMSLPELERSLGEAGHAWAVSLLKRAATRKRVFSLVNVLGDLNEVLFEFHYSRLPGEREGLMVVLRPHLPNRVQILDDSFSDVA